MTGEPSRGREGRRRRSRRIAPARKIRPQNRAARFPRVLTCPSVRALLGAFFGVFRRGAPQKRIVSYAEIVYITWIMRHWILPITEKMLKRGHFRRFRRSVETSGACPSFAKRIQDRRTACATSAPATHARNEGTSAWCQTRGAGRGSAISAPCIRGRLSAQRPRTSATSTRTGRRRGALRPLVAAAVRPSRSARRRRVPPVSRHRRRLSALRGLECPCPSAKIVPCRRGRGKPSCAGRRHLVSCPRRWHGRFGRMVKALA